MGEKFESILTNPTPCRGRPDLFSGCPIAGEGKRVILFRGNKPTLQVVRVIPGAMGSKRHLRPSSKNQPAGSAVHPMVVTVGSYFL